MMAIRLGSERFTDASNRFAGMSSGSCGSGSAIANGLLNGSVFGNDMDHLSGQFRGLAKSRDAARFGLSSETSPDNAVIFESRCAATRQAHQQSSTICLQQPHALRPYFRRPLQPRETSPFPKERARRQTVF